MYPLATKDGLTLACWALGGLYFSVSLYLWPPLTSSGWLPRLGRIAVSALSLSVIKLIFLSFTQAAGSLPLLLALCVTSHFISPPPHLPHIFPVLTSSLSCLLFVCFTAHTHYLQFSATPTTGVSMETTDVVKTTETMATDKQSDPTVYENTGRPINISYPLITDKEKKLK